MILRRCYSISSLAILLLLAGYSAAAPAARIAAVIDTRKVRALRGHTNPQARPEFDQGPADATTPMEHILLLVKPAPEQQADLDRLLADQQNPSSAQYRKWLTPEQYGERFGLTAGDAAKISAWLATEGLKVDEVAKARNWIAFTGTAGQVSKALRTSIHRYRVNGRMHVANAADPSVPEALADVVDGFLGLDDFQLHSNARLVDPLLNSNGSHYLAPEDFATIYNLSPLYGAGIDGTGQSIAVVGQTAIQLSDIRNFRSRYNLPANDPHVLFYGGTDPGVTGDLIEADLDLQWAGAIAPNASIYYVYGTNAFTAMTAAINANLAPVISVSYGGCELNFAPSAFRAVGQQANAQGITILVSSGDAGAAGCDRQGSEALATRGRMLSFPAVLPEVTAVGGTQFVEGSSNYWAATNSPNFGSALSYIPETAWNESDTKGLASTGGGLSALYPKAAWQTGPGVPEGTRRAIPDISLSAAGHDAYMVNYLGANAAVGGTSASAPSMAGIVALLNQYQISKGLQTQPGLGNINPQLYRLAQSSPTAFHDITSGNNIVPCAQGSPDCTTGSFGFEAGPGYDMATGLGSLDANNLVTQWNTKTSGVSVDLFVNSTRTTLNDTIGMTVTISPMPGPGTPTGHVDFVSGTTPLGSVELSTRDGQQVADLFIPASKLGATGTFSIAANYSGDAAFSSGGTTQTVRVTAGSGAAAILLSGPNTVWPNAVDAHIGLSWQTSLTVREVAGVAALITEFTIDGQPQPLAQYVPAPSVAPSGSVSISFVLRGLAPPTTRTFGISGTDAAGHNWSRQITVNYFPTPSSAVYNDAVLPSVVTQNPAAPSGCQWQAQISVDEYGGFFNLITSLTVDGVNRSSQIPAVFGTARLDAYSSVQGTLCYDNITPPASSTVTVGLSSGVAQDVTVTFAGPPSKPAKLSASPANLLLAAASADESTQATLNIDLSDPSAQWNITVYPPNTSAGWLKLSKTSGTGSGPVTLTASGQGFAPGAYRAMLFIESSTSIPQYLTVPVMFILGPSGPVISAVGNAASYQPTGSAGMLLSVFGTGLANSTAIASGNPLPLSLAGVTATVNGLAAPVLYASPTQLNILIPYEAGAGTAVLGVNNNGKIAGFQFTTKPAAPGTFADSSGAIAGTPSASRGSTIAIYTTGAGDVSPALKTFATVPADTFSSTAPPKPILPVSVTVGGKPAMIVFTGQTAGSFGVTQINLIVPDSVDPGVQPVVVTVNGVTSQPVNLTVQ